MLLLLTVVFLSHFQSKYLKILKSSSERSKMTRNYDFSHPIGRKWSLF